MLNRGNLDEYLKLMIRSFETKEKEHELEEIIEEYLKIKHEKYFKKLT
jgi:hypothetical protein